MQPHCVFNLIKFMIICFISIFIIFGLIIKKETLEYQMEKKDLYGKNFLF